MHLKLKRWIKQTSSIKINSLLTKKKEDEKKNTRCRLMKKKSNDYYYFHTLNLNIYIPDTGY